MERILVANLPPMTGEAIEDFENNGGVWGEQRKIRRNQLQLASASAITLASSATYCAVFRRNNTKLVGFSIFVISGFAGLVLGNSLGKIFYPSVARNDETTMMRRLWWAKKCHDQ